MTFQFVFVGGPLDGLRLDGSDEDLPRNCFDLGSMAFKDSREGTVGATFNAFHPREIGERRQFSPDIDFQTYRVEERAIGKNGHWRIQAGYVGPSDRTLPGALSGFTRWARS